MIDESQRRVFDLESRRFGPSRRETLLEVEQRLERQATVTELVARLEESLRLHPERTPIDAARNICTWLTGDYEIRRR